MRSIAKLMKDWQFTGPNGVTTAVELPFRFFHFLAADATKFGLSPPD